MQDPDFCAFLWLKFLSLIRFLMSSFNHGRVEDRILIVMKGARLSAISIKVLLKAIQALLTVREVSMFSQEAECRSSAKV